MCPTERQERWHRAAPAPSVRSYPPSTTLFFSRNIQALQARLFESGLTLLLASSDYEYEREQREVQILVERGIDGLMLVGAARNPFVYQLLKKRRVPYVNTWMYQEDSAHPCVGFDNVQAASQIAAYLLDIGHRRIAMVAGIKDGNDRVAARIEGVEAALPERGIPICARAPGRA